ncbi:pyruvate carboxylase [Paucilactobacillus hokkaidonensis JCM 18461]|uniref:Pyruvate carboxylase n=2 Tax=Paucilactobacillus hokkaidonensis TaxID=1193095 RepID=A0A0A1GY93_9LACO|nr:pyruvate carboxylase [Paucilactobacillus hokkaidonensis]BAP85874.1 pyruvate carboxylase [Paucilactobacillus hokkaidonensis JCM 18461]
MEKVMVANRGEIATRIFRAIHELKMTAVAIYAKEDEYSEHRFKADEAYLVGAGEKPIAAYLDIEDIIRVAKEHNVDAIHPGYGFLSENAQFAKRCGEEGITFIGPKVEHLQMFGDKIAAKRAAKEANVPIIPGTSQPVETIEAAKKSAQEIGYPIFVKAAMGGGGRGMRIVKHEADLIEAYTRAQSEATQSFGDCEIYLEKYLASPKHIEVQILADKHGNVMHLFERDCSVQRRNQKVIEIAPAVALPVALRQKICAAAVRFMQHVNYLNAATVEFLVEGDQFYFIEVNPRVQVEHTITEMITGFDIVQAQILIAQGCDLHKEINLPNQDELSYHGAAIQARVTTEDPANNFMPDTGKISTYISPGGNGVRLDGGNAFTGSVITPYFDSLLVKAIVAADTFSEACDKMSRVLNEFTIRGVKTNLEFMKNVIAHPTFAAGKATTTFIEETPELFNFRQNMDRRSRLLNYIANTTVNGFPGVSREKKYYPEFKYAEEFVPLDDNLVTAKDVLEQSGPDAVVDWLKQQKPVLLTDTTMRDAHQSLFATRMRTKDMTLIAPQLQRALPQLFSYEMWGGATFDVAYRFLAEDPWARLRELRKLMPRTLTQMLFRGSNAVGYQNYPDNVLKAFIDQSADAGMDVFRIFDSLNWVDQMEKSIQYVRDNNKIAEATMCYTGDILDPNKTKYNLKYYTDLAKELEAAGAHIIAIKDMAGLLKPEAAYRLISTLKETVDLPIHLHTHDTTGNGVYTYAQATKAGVDIVDVASSSMSGTTSQPSMGSLYYALQNTDRQPNVDIKNVEAVDRYWKTVRPYYQQFSNKMAGPQTDIYQTEMPGGQYSNLQQQANALRLGDRFEEVKKMYRQVNLMFGDIIKVTPSSKVVGDMALFMVQHDLTPQYVEENGDQLDFPDSVVDFFMGDLGQPTGGFPKKLQQIILKGKKPLTVRPGSLAKPVDFKAAKQELSAKLGHPATQDEVVSYVLYPKVFMDYTEMQSKYGPVSLLDTPTFFQGMRLGERVDIELSSGNSMIVSLNQVGEPDEDGQRTLYFDINGHAREVRVADLSVHKTVSKKRKAEPSKSGEIGATMSGSVLKVLVAKGDQVAKGDPIVVTEAMKMETTIQAPIAGTVAKVYVEAGDVIDNNDLLIEIN